jgi:hypothetical protein
MLNRGDVDVEMALDAEGETCAFCDTRVDSGVPEIETTCLRCRRGVCGKCGVRQYLPDGDYVACLECIHEGQV